MTRNEQKKEKIVRNKRIVFLNRKREREFDDVYLISLNNK